MIQNMEKEDSCRKTANTEYVPTKCRITKPTPPKPATHPLQFVRVGPCPLYKKAQEQIKKASDVKVIRKEVREEAEDWQHNLDSWKSNRRKLQEHIIERVEEVKKLEQEGQERTRKKSALGEKRGRPRFNIPVYDDDSNDLSDYGIGLSSSKSDKSSDNASQSSKDDINECQNLQYGSNDMHVETKPNDNDIKTDQLNNHINNLKAKNSNDYTSSENNIGQYTYEGAIQNYRMRIKTKINVNEVNFNNRQSEPPKNKEYNEVQSLLPKGNIFKRRELFESERNSVENQETNAQRKFSEDFANSQSIKERLQSLEKCTESSVKNDNRNSLPVGTITSKFQKFNNVTDNFSKENKNNFGESAVKSASSYSLDGMSSGGEENKNKWGEKYEYDRYFSPEDSIFMDKINMFNRDLDTLYPKSSSDNCNDEILNSYPPSTSSTELMLLSSDKEDSGIHTADVSCSVSQSDEVLEDPDTPSNTIPKCIEKLNIEKITKENQLVDVEEDVQSEENIQLEENIHQKRNVFPEENVHQDRNVFLEENARLEQNLHLEENIRLTDNLHLENNTRLTDNLHLQKNISLEENKANADLDEFIQPKVINKEEIPFEAINSKQDLIQLVQPEVNKKEETPFEATLSKQALIQLVQQEEENPILTKQDLISNITASEIEEIESVPIIGNLEESFKNLDVIKNDLTLPLPLQETPIDLAPFEIDCLEDDNMLLSPVLPKLRPPAVKPPPPPVSDSEQPVNNVDNDKKFNTTKRLKKEILIKRSTFLGLDEPTDDQMFPNVPIDKPPDVNNFLQKLNGAREGSSKEDLTNKFLPVSESNPDITSKTPKIQQTIEEDEISKKEREIIEMVEKEEKCKDHDPIPSKEDFPNMLTNYSEQYPYNYNNPYYLDSHYDNLDDRDSEVLKVEHELLQLEKEEQERQKENMLFREKSMKMKQNYHSYENLCDVNVFLENADYYKSMPELQQFPKDYNNKPSVLNHKPMYENTSFYRKSMPEIEHGYNALDTDYNQPMMMGYNKVQQSVMTANHRKTSMPELQKVPQVVSNLPIIPAKPLKRPTKEEKEMFKSLHYEKQMKPIARHSLQPSSASRPKHHDNWRQPKINAEPKNYNQHWLIQEAEFRRISEMQNSIPNRVHSNSHLNNFGSGNMPIKPGRPEPPVPKESQLPHLGHPPQSGYSLMPYSSSTGIDESQNVILSVSGKKKCSYCGNELGRGAAMIIETLNLFYHMECFKCCVCHVELGDGLMGTDVRVRNQKLHCHNCYSSDDGVKFSCV